MKANPDAPRGPAIRLAENFLQSLGLTCLWADALPSNGQHTRLLVRSIAGRRVVGAKIWFRSAKQVEAVQREILASCKHASRGRDGVAVKLPAGQTVEMVGKCARLIGITPIDDENFATTFDSVVERIEAALARMQRSGEMKRINREYSELRKQSLDDEGTSQGTKGTSGTPRATPLPSYSDWLVKRLGNEITKCTESVHITRL